MAWYTRAFNLFRSNRISHDIKREMAFHVGERVEELMQSGMTEEQAMFLARRQFGNATELRETTRDTNMLTAIESVANDLRYACRVLRASPVFTVFAVLSFALGIGANTAIFSLINAVMLKSLPVNHAESLVTISSSMFGSELTNPIWEQIRNRQTTFANVAAFAAHDFDLSNGGVVRRASGSWVSGDYFNTLGVNAAVGRLLVREDDTRGCAAAAVVSYGFWQRELGGKASVAGTMISLDHKTFTVIGVTTPEFFGAEVGKTSQIFAPLCAMAVVGRGEMLDEKRGWFLYLIGRLKPEQTIAQAEQGLAQITPLVVSQALTEDAYTKLQKEKTKFAFQLTGGVGELSGLKQAYKTALFILMAVVSVVLCIGCANVANLLLARSAARSREIAVRFALGASRTRVVRQLLTETLLLTAVGALAGVLFAKWSTGLLVGLLSSGGSSVALTVPIDARVLLFTIAVTTLTGLLFGLVPAWRATRVSPQETMRAHARGIAAGHSRFSVAKVLVVGQVALSLVLVVGAALLLGTFRTLSNVNPGFDSENVLIASVDYGSANLAASELLVQSQRVIDQLRVLPGVTSVSTSVGTPVSGGGWNGGIAVDGYAPQNPRDALVYLNEVSGDYFATLRTPIKIGRTFDNRDQPNAPRVAMISETAAKKFFAGGNPVGRQFHMPSRKSEGPAYEVIGVVADSKYRSLREEPRALVYFAASQNADPSSNQTYALKFNSSAQNVAASVTALVNKVNPQIALSYRMLDDQVAASLVRERLLATLSGFFGALALLLAVIGLYGTMSYGVHRRRNEIGVRLALGAGRQNVFAMVLREVGLVLLVGLVIGTCGALAASRFVASFLFGVTPTDVATLAWSIGTLAAVAAIAGAVPAWRAARLDPMVALRED